MHRTDRSIALASALAAMLSIAAAHPANAAWGVDGAVVCNAANSQSPSVALSDGVGGVYTAWFDVRQGASSPLVFAQHLSATGIALWAANGQQLEAAGYFAKDVAIASDGAGGALFVWSQGDLADRGFDVYAQHLNFNGVAQWTSGGVPICTIHGTALSPKNKVTATICADGAAGAYIAWDDGRAGTGLHDIYAQHVNASGVVQWVTDGVPVCTNGSLQSAPVISSGAAGNAVAMWLDQRNGNQDLFAQRLNDPSGGVAWTVEGVAVCNAAGTQSDLTTAADGSSAYAAWSDQRAGVGVYNAFMQRLNPATGAGLFGANGQLVSTVGSGNKLRPQILYNPIDAGSVVAWQDHRNGLGDIYAQRFDGNGIQQWANGGVQLANLADAQSSPVAVSDGANGAFVAWTDVHADGSSIGQVTRVDLNGAVPWGVNGTNINSTNTNATTPANVRTIVADGTGGVVVGYELGLGTATDVYAQRVAASSNLADYDAIVSTVADLPGDEGGFVRIATGGAIGDYAPASPPVTGYNVWRQIAPMPPASPSARSGADDGDARARGLAALAAAGVPGGPAQIDPLAAQSVGFPSGTWESLGFNAARGLTSYMLAVATPADSSILGSADYSYVLTVHTTVPTLYAVSNVRAGHSVDNLPPGAPQNATGQLVGPSTVRLDWSANVERDLAHYSVYRGASAGFTPGPGNLLGTSTLSTFVDGGFSASYYKLSSVDRHGNESPFTTLAPGSILGVAGPEIPGVSFLGAPAPNPFRSLTTVELGMAASGRASLRVFDVGGRFVRVLADGEVEAGLHPVTWDGRDARGRTLAAGVYLLRFEGGGSRWTRRVLLAR